MKEKMVPAFMLLSAALVILLSSFEQFMFACEKQPEKVLRLHIVANSDSDDDQNQKYALRDFLIKTYSEKFQEAGDAAAAASTARFLTNDIAFNSNKFIHSEGSPYSVNVTVEKSYFTTRRYGDYTLPAGKYTALKVVIGEGKGKNWWCVMFPPLCLPAVMGKDDKAVEAFLTKEQSKQIEAGKNIEVKFAFFEFLCKIFGWQ